MQEINLMPDDVLGSHSYLAILASQDAHYVEGKVIRQIESNSLWWTVLCLDGASERRLYTSQCRNDPIRNAGLLAAEKKFLELALWAAYNVRAAPPKVKICAKWVDGVIFGYADDGDAIRLAEFLASKCQELNGYHRLPWNWEYHVRVGIGPSIREMFSGLLVAKQDQLCKFRENPGKPGYTAFSRLVA